MSSRAWVLVGLGSVGALLAAGLAVAPVVAKPAPDTDRAAAARLAADADGRLTVRDGFVGVPAGVEVDNPAVTSKTPVAAAADAHLARYGAALGASSATLRRSSVEGAVSGNDRVRYRQYVGGLPVLGGEVLVNLRADRSLASVVSDLAAPTAVTAPRLGASAAADRARERVARTSRTPGRLLTVESAGRWFYDPATVGLASGLGARSVWRFEVTGGPAVRRLVLVDDQLGAVLLEADLIAHVDRAVCDNRNKPRFDDPCTSRFARVEGGPVSTVTDVNGAYDLSGAVADFYEEVGGLDVTAQLGVEVDGKPLLGSTVRYCIARFDCPMQNAFWNGVGMFYGDGFANADDVTGHEMTHGVIEHGPELLYWGQSGAINESLADVMGEILDHRHPSPGDTADSWQMGEDLVGIGALRDLADPREFDQPDRMTSKLYTNDSEYGYYDGGGVHTNSGVGNKTAYLISQGGTFNGQTITGIDAGDPGLGKTAVLYFDAMHALVSGSDYANLADALDQTCQDLVTGGVAGFTAADCATVQAAVLATELRTTPTNAPQPADAPMTCPEGTEVRVMFDSETGNPAGKFSGRRAVWKRDAEKPIGRNAYSGTGSWFARNTDPAWTGGPRIGRLRSEASILLPAGQPSFVHFQHWWVYEYAPGRTGRPRYFDGGTVEIDDRSDNRAAVDASGLPWVNGPERVLASGWGTVHGGISAFAGDSFGWLASRVDVSAYAGRPIRLQFTSRSNRVGSIIGWFLDDIRVYTCDPA